MENQYLNGALDKNGKIFVESYSENDKKNGITVIDKDSAKIEKRINFERSGQKKLEKKKGQRR